MKQYVCDDDDLGCLHDYLVAAIAGNDISELPRLWNQQIGVIHSRQHDPNKPRPPCEECIYQARSAEHDAAIRKEGREKALNEMRDAIRNAKQYGTIEPEVLFHWTGIIAIIDSIRTQEPQQ